MKTGTWTYEDGTLSLADSDEEVLNYNIAELEGWTVKAWLDRPSQEEAQKQQRAELVQKGLDTWSSGRMSRYGFKCWLERLPNVTSVARPMPGFAPTTEIRTSGYTFQVMTRGDFFCFSRKVTAQDLREDENFLRWLSAHLDE